MRIHVDPDPNHQLEQNWALLFLENPQKKHQT